MTSVFASRRNGMFITHRASLKLRGWLMAGVPKDPNIVEGWLRTKTMITDEEELRQLAMRTFQELGVPIPENATYDEIIATAEAMALAKKTNGFKRDERGLYIEGRQLKAMIKENVNIVYAKKPKGLSNKGAKNYVAERVFIVEDRVYLDRAEPDGVHAHIGHVSGPDGPRSTLTNIEYVDQALLSFTVLEMRARKPTPDVERTEDGKETKKKINHDVFSEPSLTDDEWANVWMSAEENGLGSLRSQSWGRFDLVEWEVVTP